MLALWKTEPCSVRHRAEVNINAVGNRRSAAGLVAGR